MAKEFGIFEWTAENRYPRRNAKKIFKSEKRADAYERKQYAAGNNLVVRSIYD